MSVQQYNGNEYWVLPNGTWYIPGGDQNNCTVSVCPIELSVYGYRPTLPGSSAAIALYGICLFVQLFLGLRYKTPSYMYAMIFGCITEIVGYAGRIMYYQNPFAQPGFIIQIVLIGVAPLFFCAAIYITLSRIINYISPAHARFPSKFFYWIFIPSDVISLALQGAGGAMSSISNGQSNVGVNISLAGLSLQVFTLFVFMVLTIDYAIRSRKVWQAFPLGTAFKIFITSLVVAVVTIFTRCCYRVYELSKGYSSDSEALRDQTLYNALELSMVLIATYALIASHPGFVFKRGVEGPEEQRRRIEGEKIAESSE